MAIFFHFINFRMDLCVPSTCTREDMQRVTSFCKFILVVNTLINLVFVAVSKFAEYRSHVTRCEVQTDDSSLDATFWMLR